LWDSASWTFSSEVFLNFQFSLWDSRIMDHGEQRNWQLSILFVRFLYESYKGKVPAKSFNSLCEILLLFSLFKFSIFTFNSLCEIHPHYRRGQQPRKVLLSILFVRFCTNSLGPVYQCSTFNSLCEILNLWQIS